jgi:hypothetical protein
MQAFGTQYTTIFIGYSKMVTDSAFFTPIAGMGTGIYIDKSPSEDKKYQGYFEQGKTYMYPPKVSYEFDHFSTI